MKNTTILRSVMETPDEKSPQGATNDPLEQLLAEPATSAPKARKRAKLAQATPGLPDDLVDAQERYAYEQFHPSLRSFAGEDELVQHDRALGILVLQRTRYLADGSQETYFPCTVEDTIFSDTSNNIQRNYKMVKWDSEVRTYVRQKFGLDQAKLLWKASLTHYGLHKDGLYVKEQPIKAEPVDPDKPKRGGRGGGGGGRKPPEWFRIAATPVRLDNLIKDEHGIFTLELSFFNVDYVESEWETALIPLAQLHDDGSGSAWKSLQGRGLLFGADKRAPQKFRQLVLDFYSDVCDDASEYLQMGRSKPGWHTLAVKDDKGVRTNTRVYVAPGFSTHSSIRFTGSDTMKWSKAGDESTYLSRFGHMLHRNPLVALVCSWVVAGLLVSEFDEIDHNPILSILGETSIGKSLAAQTAVSMRGNHDVLFKSMDATGNTMKERMQSFRGLGGAVDEIGSMAERMDAKQKITTIYQWSQGDAKGRLQRDSATGRYQEPAADRARYSLLLTGENAFVDMNAVPGGNQVRMSQIVFTKDEPLWHGIANNTEAEEWRGFINNNYGHLYPKLVHLVAANLDRYKKIYAEHYAVLTASILDSKERRKANAWALALTGASLLAEELHQVKPLDATSDNDELVPGFTPQDVLVVRQHALRLLIAELDTTPIQSEAEKYMDFLEGLPTRHGADLLMEDPLALRGNAKGTYSWVKVPDPDKKSKMVKQHTLCIINEEFDHMCGGKVDRTRLLRWAQENNILVTSTQANGTDAKGNPKMVVRQTVKMKVQNGRNNCYKFVWLEREAKNSDAPTKRVPPDLVFTATPDEE